MENIGERRFFFFYLYWYGCGFVTGTILILRADNNSQRPRNTQFTHESSVIKTMFESINELRTMSGILNGRLSKVRE